MIDACTHSISDPHFHETKLFFYSPGACTSQRIPIPDSERTISCPGSCSPGELHNKTYFAFMRFISFICWQVRFHLAPTTAPLYRRLASCRGRTGQNGQNSMVTCSPSSRVNHTDGGVHTLSVLPHLPLPVGASPSSTSKSPYQSL